VAIAVAGIITVALAAASSPTYSEERSITIVPRGAKQPGRSSLDSLNNELGFHS
jgi:hypothetical protein